MPFLLLFLIKLLVVFEFNNASNNLDQTTYDDNGMMDPFQVAQARQPHCKDPYKLFGPICLELCNPGVSTLKCKRVEKCSLSFLAFRFVGFSYFQTYQLFLLILTNITVWHYCYNLILNLSETKIKAVT